MKRELVVVVAVFLCVKAEKWVVVGTKYGRLEGKVLETDSGFEADVFLGVPYARPPFRELRFQKPAEVSPWEGLRNARLRWPQPCAQNNYSNPNQTVGSIDCLYLNIFAPHNRDEKVYNPVIVWIHGGSFQTGSSTVLISDVIDRIVSRGVIVVTLQYRLGPYGFFSSNDGNAEGNFGLWDQTRALHWIGENIANFGGNPAKITLMGDEAGAVSISLLTLSPRSNELFHQAILLGGSYHSPMAFSPAVDRASDWLAETLACDVPSKYQMLLCLKTKSMDEISDAISKLTSKDSRRMGLFGGSLSAFIPKYDGVFFPEPIGDLLMKAPKKPTISGLVRETAAYFANIVPGPMSNPFMFNSKNMTFSEFRYFLRQTFANELGDNEDYLRKRILEHYVYDVGDKHDTAFLAGQFSKLLHDLLFLVPSYKEAMEKAKADWPLWLYYDENPRNTGIKSICGRDYSSELFLTVLVNFVKNGEPSHDGDVNWNRATVDDLRYLHITGDSVELRPSFKTVDISFWTDIISDDHEILRYMPKELSKQELEDKEWSHDEL